MVTGNRKVKTEDKDLWGVEVEFSFENLLLVD